MLLQIDRNSEKTIFEQMVSQIAGLIDAGDLAEGFRMPATRQLAFQVGVNRSTVARVYDELWALGYLESTPGSYTKVRKRVKPVSAMVGNKDEMSWASIAGNGYQPDIAKSNRFAEVIEEEAGKTIGLHRLEPDVRLIDKAVISTCFRELMVDAEHNLFGYSHPRGFAPLRGEIVSHMRRHSINVADENVLISNGSQNSLQLIFQAFVASGDVIAVETPTYSLIVPLLRLCGARIVEIPCDSNGMDVEALARLLERERIKLVYTISTFNNPTGATMPQENREKLLSLCEKHNVIIVEDSIEEELKFFGKVHLPIKSIDRHGRVIYLGTFSKVLAPGLRTGWIIAHRDCISRLTALKTITDLSSNTLSQSLLYRFCHSGHYELHLRKLQRVFRKRMKVAIKALKRFLPADSVEWSEPMGGYLIWIKLLKVPEGTMLANHFKRYGVQVADGAAFFLTPPKERFIRISISKSNEHEIEEGIRRLGKAIVELEQTSRLS